MLRGLAKGQALCSMADVGGRLIQHSCRDMPLQAKQLPPVACEGTKVQQTLPETPQLCSLSPWPLLPIEKLSLLYQVML